MKLKKMAPPLKCVRGMPKHSTYPCILIRKLVVFGVLWGFGSTSKYCVSILELHANGNMRHTPILD